MQVRTIFNFLGPLTNPAGARRQLIGVSDPAFLETIAGALARLGVDRALVVCSEDGLDEISIAAATTVIEVNGEELIRYTLTPRDVGVEPADPAGDGGGAARGRTPRRTPRSPARSFAGSRGPHSDLAAINAGAAIYAAGGADSIAEGVEAAREALAGGQAADALERFVQASARHAPERAASARDERARRTSLRARASSSRGASATLPETRVARSGARRPRGRASVACATR